MKTVFLALIVLTASLALYGQSGRKAVVWSGDAACGFRTKAFAPTDNLSCSTVTTERGPVSTVTYNGMTLSAAFLEDGDYYLVAAHISNPTNEIVGFDSDLWGAAHYRTRDDFYTRKPPITAETSIPSRDLIRSMASGTKLENSLGDFMGDIAMTTETREYKRADGTKYKVSVIVPDQEAQAAEQRQRITRGENLTSRQMRIRETALTAKSVMAGSSLKGLVYFRRVKNAEYVVFSLSVADAAFIFQVPRTKKP
nr:hypothetical protein [uncultured bacterium]